MTYIKYFVAVSFPVLIDAIQGDPLMTSSLIGLVMLAFALPVHRAGVWLHGPELKADYFAQDSNRTIEGYNLGVGCLSVPVLGTLVSWWFAAGLLPFAAIFNLYPV